ncbi:MAG: hypothetical protein HC805_06030 [Alkalinema sp. RL_2_19]|nr:hypothetical protein [Alkalinema sp. RL_2_19]
MAPPILKRYLLAIGRYKWVIPTGVGLGLAASGLVVSQPPPDQQYIIQATLWQRAAHSIFGHRFGNPAAD